MAEAGEEPQKQSEVKPETPKPVEEPKKRPWLWPVVGFFCPAKCFK